MYDDLIKTIRQNTCHFDACGMCPKRNALCLDRIALQAADAIEELSAIREEQKAQIIAMAAEDKPRWIPITEKLPEEDGCYLVAVKNDHQRRYSKTAWFSHDSWLARQDVTHWMSLPEPPKEET